MSNPNNFGVDSDGINYPRRTVMSDGKVIIERRISEEEERVWQNGRCPICFCCSLHDKGSYEACNDCGTRIGLLGLTNDMIVQYFVSVKDDFDSSTKLP